MLREIPVTDPALRKALSDEGLPTADLGRGRQRFFTWEDDDGRVVAHAGLEGAGADRLLRSVVVAHGERGRGLAVRIVAALEHLARSDGAERLWLLTETAGPVFDRLHWRRAPRDEAPEAITTSREFATLCPASAICMVRDLAP